MPVNDRYPLADVLDACLAWRAARNRKVYVEYLMLDGVNDSPGRRASSPPPSTPREAFKVNLIPYNPTGGLYSGSERERDRALPRRARPPRRAGDRPPHPRPRHRRRLRPARRDRRLSQNE